MGRHDRSAELCVGVRRIPVAAPDGFPIRQREALARHGNTAGKFSREAADEQPAEGSESERRARYKLALNAASLNCRTSFACRKVGEGFSDAQRI